MNLRWYLKDSNKPISGKIMVIFGIMYLLSPIDLLPEPVFGIVAQIPDHPVGFPLPFGQAGGKEGHAAADIAADQKRIDQILC